MKFSNNRNLAELIARRNEEKAEAQKAAEATTKEKEEKQDGSN